MDNRGMRLPSQKRLRASRGVLARAVLLAVLAALAALPATGSAAGGDRGVFVSKGVGRQIFAGGGGVAYGIVFSGGSLVVTDYSSSHDMKVEAPVQPSLNQDGSRTYVPAGGAERTAFRISGTLYRVTVQGSGTFNAAGVWGRLQVRGKGTLTVNGKRTRWPATVKLGKVPKAQKSAYELAQSGAPIAVQPPPASSPVTTSGS
jgi:hypothetical protein